MGLFDFFSRKPKHEAAPEPPAPAVAPPAPPDPRLSPWQQSLWTAERTPGFAWNDDNAPARAFVRALLARAAPTFGQGRVVNAEPAQFLSPASIVVHRFGGSLVHEKDSNPELHGEWEGMPVRIPISIPAKKVWAIEMRCDERARFFDVLRDPDRIPRARDPQDPWTKGQPECVFLGRGIFLDDADPDTMRDWMVPHWASVPAAAQELVVRDMERLDLRYLSLSNAHRSLLVLGNRTLDRLEDPVAYIEACAALLAGLAKGLAASAGAPLPSSGAAPQRITCRYCASIFLLAIGDNRCPNCGAPAAA